MTIEVGEFVRLFVNGTERTEYVISYSRKDSLCELGVSFTIELSPEYPATLDPYDDIKIREYYSGNLATVLKGYSISIEKSFDTGSFIMIGQDKSILLHEYFIDHQIEGNGESVDYWINYIAGLAGLSVQFNVTSPAIVDAGTPLGLQNAADVILMLERKAAYYIKYDSSLNKLVVFRLGTSEPSMTITTGEPIAVNQTLGTENTRNIVKIYGGYKFDLITGLSEQVFVKAEANVPELIVDKIAVIANPSLRSFTSAYVVANRILDVVSGIDDEQIYQLAGFFPDRTVGESVYVDVDFKNIDIKGNQIITSIEASVSKSDGVITNIGTGDKCPRLSVQLPIPPILVTTDLDGVGVSWNGGDSFVPSNIGLTSGADKNAWSIAANQYSQQMVLTSGGIYRRFGTGGVWSIVPTTLPNPINEAADSPAPLVTSLELTKVVEEPTNPGRFHILTNVSGMLNPARSWIYSTPDFGNTWDSKQLYITKTPPASGIIDWSVAGLDIEAAPTNALYTLVHGVTINDGIYFARPYIVDYSWNLYTWYKNDAPVLQGNITAPGSQFIPAGFCMFSRPDNRGYAAAVTIKQGPSNKPALSVAITKDKGDTWSTIFSGNYTGAKPVGSDSLDADFIGWSPPDAYNYYSSGVTLFYTVRHTYSTSTLVGGCMDYTVYNDEGIGYIIDINFESETVTVSPQDYQQTYTFSYSIVYPPVGSGVSFTTGRGMYGFNNGSGSNIKYSGKVIYSYQWNFDPISLCSGPDPGTTYRIFTQYADNPAETLGDNNGSSQGGICRPGYSDSVYHTIFNLGGGIMIKKRGPLGAGYNVEWAEYGSSAALIPGIVNVEINENL